MDHDPRPKIFAFAAAYYGVWIALAMVGLMLLDMHFGFVTR
jgi:hypothetical protein